MPNGNSGSSFGIRLLTQTGITAGVCLVIIVTTILLRAGTEKKIALIAEKNNAVNAYSDSVRNLAELKKNFQETATEQATLNQILPTRDRLLKIPKEIRLEAQKFGLTAAMTLSTEFEAKDDSLPGIAFHLKIDGAMDSAVVFMEKLKTLPYLISLDSVNVSGEENKATLDIGGRIFAKN